MTKNRDQLLATPVESGKFSVPKNLVWACMGMLIAAVVIVIFVKVTFSDKPVKQESKLQKAPVNTSQAPSESVIEGIAEKQRAEAQKQEQERKAEEAKRAAQQGANGSGPAVTPIPGHTGTFPEAGSNGSVVLPKPAAIQGRDPEMDRAARENLIRSSPIIAINDGFTMPGQRTGANLAGGASGDIDDAQRSLEQAQRNREAAASSVEDRAARTIAGLQNMQGKPKSARSLESEWLQEVAEVKTSKDALKGYYPKSRFVLFQGSIINAVTMNALNTDLPGEIRARTTMDVYGSIATHTLLIPKGTVLVGRYNSDVRVGQERINTGFTRMILPNGMSVDLKGNIGQDQSGAAGLPGDVDNHYGRMFFVSILTAIGASVAERHAPSNSGTTVNTGSGGGISSGAAQVFVDVNRAVIDRNRHMAPTITVPAGMPFTISVTQDIELPPYKQ